MRIRRFVKYRGTGQESWDGLVSDEFVRASEPFVLKSLRNQFSRYRYSHAVAFLYIVGKKTSTKLNHADRDAELTVLLITDAAMRVD